MKDGLQVKIFESAHPSTLEKEVNAFLHPLTGARIGRQHFSVVPSGMGNLYCVMVEYIEIGTEDEE